MRWKKTVEEQRANQLLDSVNDPDRPISQDKRRGHRIVLKTTEEKQTMKTISDPRVVKAQIVRHEYLELRLKGMTYQQIGDKYGVGSDAVFGVVQRELDKIVNDTTESAKQLKAIELQRLDMYLQRLDKKISDGDISAVSAALKVAERRAKYLGLDTAQQIEVSFGDLLAQIQDEEE